MVGERAETILELLFKAFIFQKKGHNYIHGNLEDLAIRSSHL